MTPIYKSAGFYTMVIAILIQIAIGFGVHIQPEMLATCAATVIAYLVQSGILTKAELEACLNYEVGFEDGKAAALTPPANPPTDGK